MIRDWITRTIAGEKIDIDPSVSPSERERFMQFQAFVNRYKPRWLAVNLTVSSAEHGYTETLDWLAMIGQYRVAGLLNLDRDDGGYPTQAMRLAAIALSGDPALGQVDRCVILRLRLRHTLLVPVNAFDLDEWFSIYLITRQSQSS